MYTVSLLPGLSLTDLPQASRLLGSIAPQPVACNNWAGEFPYAPEVSFRMAHNDEAIFLRFDVNEKYTMARITEDNGEVWTDSCVEFFMAIDDSGYYNFEFTCIGKALAGFRKELPNPVHGSPAIMQSIQRYSTLGTENFEEKTGDNHWSLTTAIPASALFKHHITRLSGLKAKANVYKCGDKLSKPHFLSWQPIEMPAPNFHVPQFFTDIEF